MTLLTSSFLAASIGAALLIPLRTLESVSSTGLRSIPILVGLGLFTGVITYPIITAFLFIAYLSGLQLVSISHSTGVGDVFKAYLRSWTVDLPIYLLIGLAAFLIAASVRWLVLRRLPRDTEANG